jgi:hypothetical protein
MISLSCPEVGFKVADCGLEFFTAGIFGHLDQDSPRPLVTFFAMDVEVTPEFIDLGV